MSRFVLVAFVVALIGCANKPYNGRAAISDASFLKTKKIALAHDLENFNGDHLWIQQSLSQAFIENGWQVVERFRLEDLFRETTMDETGSTTTLALDSTAAQDSSRTTSMSLDQLKKFGEMFNVNYLGFYGFRRGEQLYLRIVDCQTGRVSAVVTYEGTWGTMQPLQRMAIADILVKVALTSAEEKEKTGEFNYSFTLLSLGDIYISQDAVSKWTIPLGNNEYRQLVIERYSSMRKSSTTPTVAKNPKAAALVFLGIAAGIFVIALTQ